MDKIAVSAGWGEREGRTEAQWAALKDHLSFRDLDLSNYIKNNAKRLKDDGLLEVYQDETAFSRLGYRGNIHRDWLNKAAHSAAQFQVEGALERLLDLNTKEAVTTLVLVRCLYPLPAETEEEVADTMEGVET